ncbi:MAG: fibrobacter succinogenes major paralogous domain-containing protein [Bacteroidales bacterium]|nr:fibrobacter succinogenes major paralogous domain-containing protein [Bacteroidales bacterium]
MVINIVTASAQPFGKLVDPRDGQEYKTQKIGKQVWMAQNLNYRSAKSWCYNNDPSFCVKYGRLYTYPDAAKACPRGWHLPTENDWSTILLQAKGDTNALDLVEGGSTGFDVKLAGVRYDHGEFNHLGEYAYFWSRIRNSNDPAWVYVFTNNLPMANRIHSFPASGFSVRCVRY